MMEGLSSAGIGTQILRLKGFSQLFNISRTYTNVECTR